MGSQTSSIGNPLSRVMLFTLKLNCLFHERGPSWSTAFPPSSHAEEGHVKRAAPRSRTDSTPGELDE
jgi:hypothetical protein